MAEEKKERTQTKDKPDNNSNKKTRIGDFQDTTHVKPGKPPKKNKQGTDNK